MKSGHCPKCHGTEIILAHPAEYGDSSMEIGPIGVTAEPRWVMDGRNPRYVKGELVLYVCRACGFTEWYALEPESIPIGEQYRTEIIESPRRVSAPEPKAAVPPASNVISDEILKEFDDLYGERTTRAWASLAEELQKLRRVVDLGIVVEVAGATLRDSPSFDDWVRERYPLVRLGDQEAT